MGQEKKKKKEGGVVACVPSKSTECVSINDILLKSGNGRVTEVLR